MAKIILDKSKCIGCGTCWSLCDKFFEQGQDGRSSLVGVGDIEEKEIDKINCAKAAVDSCPVQCITII